MASKVLLLLLLLAALLVAFSMLGSSASHATTFSLSLASSSPAARRSVGHSAPPGSLSSILGPPSLSVAFINRVLLAYHSPAVGLGSVLYADSLAYGIDDAYPLAFFLHESGMGTAGWAVVNHSLGNIRCTPGWSCGGGYRYYSSWAAGFHDWFVLIASEYLPRGLSTVQTIVPVYAPSADHNNEYAYITSVLAAVSAWRAGRLVV